MEKVTHFNVRWMRRWEPHIFLTGAHFTSKVTEGVSGHTADFLLFSKRTATGPSCGKSIHIPHLRALRGCSLVSSKLLKSRKSAACLETPSITLLGVLGSLLYITLLSFPMSSAGFFISAYYWGSPVNLLNS